MKKIFFAVIMIFAMPALAFAQNPDGAAAKKKVLYFFKPGCSHCERVENYFQQEGFFEKYEIRKLDISSSGENVIILNDFFDVFGVIEPEKRGIPAVFFGVEMLAGDTSILDNFSLEIERSDASDFPTPDSVKNFLEDRKTADETRGLAKISVPIPILISAALADAINPCAFAVLILLIATVLSSGGKKKALLSGLLFSLSVFVSYFLMGLGLYKTITVFNLPKIISVIVGVIAILIGLANLKDAIWHGKFFVMEVPFSWRPKMQAIIKHVSSPIGALGAGFLVSLFLLPCTSGPYIVILGLLAERESMMRTVSLLLFYNLIFVLPMVLITIGMYFGIRLKVLDEIRKNNIKLLHAITGAAMLFIGSYLIYGWL